MNCKERALERERERDDTRRQERKRSKNGDGSGNLRERMDGGDLSLRNGRRRSLRGSIVNSQLTE